MNIYAKLPIDIQFKIILLIYSEYKNNDLHQSIKNNRKKKILKYIYSTFDTEFIGSELFFWFNKDYPKISSKYINFFINLFPGFLDYISYKKNNCLNSSFFFTGLRKSDNLFFYYKTLYIGYYKNFIELILNNFSVSDLEDFLNFLLCNNDSINILSICV